MIITSTERNVLKYGVQLQFLATNNEAEYEAILTSLRIAKALEVKNLKLRTDSKLIVRQITNEYEAKEERMKRYLKLTNQLVDYFDDVRSKQIPWENNLATDKVAKLASFEDALEKPRLYMEIPTVPSIEGLQAFPVQQSCTWMDPIFSYIKDDQLPLYSSEAKKVKVSAARFTIMNNKLYKRGFSLPYLKCLNPEDICGNHSGPWSLVGKAIRASCFWLTMQRDVVKLVKKCDKCQWFGNVQAHCRRTNDEHFFTMAIFHLVDQHCCPIATREEAS